MSAPVTAPGRPHIRVPQKFRGEHYKPGFAGKINQTSYSLTGGHMFVLVAVTVYFMLTQTIPPVTDHWNDLFPWVNHAWFAMIHGHNPFAVPTTYPQSEAWKAVRHATRDGILEGELGGGALLMFFANYLKPPDLNPGRIKRLARFLTGYTENPDWFDRAACWLHIPNPHQKDKDGNPKDTTFLQLLFSPLSILATGIPGNILGFGLFFGIPWVLHKVHVFLAGWGIASDTGTGNVATWENIGRGSFDAKMIGVLGLFFFARRAFLKIGMDQQDVLSDIRAANIVNAKTRFGRLMARPPKIWPEPYRAMVYHKVLRALDPASGYEIKRHGRLSRYITIGFVLLIPLAAWKGWDILAAAQQQAGK